MAEAMRLPLVIIVQQRGPSTATVISRSRRLP